MLLSLCQENPPVTCGFPAQSNSWTENILFGQIRDVIQNCEAYQNLNNPGCKFLIKFILNPTRFCLEMCANQSTGQRPWNKS